MSAIAGRIRNQLANDIIGRRLAPGERLDEAGVARRFGTSRTPVREAMRDLAAAGLVEITDFKGATVVRLSQADLSGILDVIADLECASARTAAQLRLPVHLRALKSALDRCVAAEAADDIVAYQVADQVFHRTICDASQNRFLIETTLTSWNRIEYYRRLTFQRQGRMIISLAEHRRIADAIMQGNAEEAEQLLRHHLRNDGLSRLYAAFLDEEKSEIPAGANA